ncbi:hypothetical protein [Microvirga roseola]|uniref:hypothetical protein n=1 Tax=Microvirga roseola TaxID=2883126 RepID=UPI001E3CB257|nr:hypothetical protein [Microvirga roseola]
MPSTTVASGTFASRKDANRAVERLVANGFARNSMELHPHDDDEGYDLEVHTRRENLRKVERLIHDSAPLYVARHAASDAYYSAKSHPYLLLGAGLLAGVALYALLPRSTFSSVASRQPHSRRQHRR